jgi:hypothetical protein
MRRNILFRYLEDVPVHDEQLDNIKNILHRPYEDLSDLLDLLDDESSDYERQNQGLAE